MVSVALLGKVVVLSALLTWLLLLLLWPSPAFLLLLPQDPRVVVSALMKLAGGSPTLAAELNADAFLRQVGLQHLCLCLAV